jgi:hypothetical protein
MTILRFNKLNNNKPKQYKLKNLKNKLHRKILKIKNKMLILKINKQHNSHSNNKRHKKTLIKIKKKLLNQTRVKTKTRNNKLK